HSLRSKSAGKGTNRTQSEVSALCEAIERYSGCRFGDEIRIRRSFEDFAPEDNAIHPNDVQLFSENQLNYAESINAEGHPYNKIPQRFDPCRAVDWTPVWSFSQKRHLYLPTSMLYGMTQESRTSMDLIADSNGCAAGNTLEEAILQGFYELVERDAFAIWWYNSLQMPSIDLESFDDEFLNQAKQYYKQYDRELWVLNVTSDIAIPTFVAISYQPNGQTEDIIYGAGAHINPRLAVLRAVCELNQCLTWLPHPGKKDGLPAIDDPMALSWWKNTRLQDCPWLVPAPDHLATVKPPPENMLQTFKDLKEEVEYCQGLVEEKGLEFLVLDQTRPDIGLNVVRVIVPGMRHFWARLAPGRLYEVPVSVGYRKIPLEESEINKVPVIA
ncbi:MAG: YcaO-like family protein, partial [Rhodobacteraceae bacterium]|nr:YcaO-like family protein [Paracoccaceae bacterium]